MHKIRTFFRRILLHHDKSDRPTGLHPLEHLHSAVVLRDVEEDSGPDEAVRQYFRQKGMTVRFMCRRDARLKSGEDLFISLVHDADFNELYAAVSSKAMFKVGAHPVKGGVFDLVVSPSDGGDARQIAVFKSMTELLEKIK